MAILEKNKNLKENDAPINALPEYKIRTMKDDLARKELEKEAIKAAPPKELPIVEEIIKKAPKPLKPEKIKPLKIKKDKPKKIKPNKEEKERIKREKKERHKRNKEEKERIRLQTKEGKEEKKKAKQERKEEKRMKKEEEREEKKKEEKPKKIERAPLPGIEELISSKLPEPPKPEKIKPPKPEKEEIKRPKEKKTREPKKPKKWLAWLLIIILIIIIVFAVFYLIGSKPEPEPEPEPPSVSESLILVDETKILNLANTSFIDLLSQEAEKDQSVGTFKRIAILKNETEFLSLNELLEKLNINIPPYAFAELENNYTLIIYSQNGKKKLELIAKVKNSDNLNDQLGFWEQTMVNDLQGLFLIESPGTPATKEFQNNNYKNTAIRYINFPEPDLTIDYAIVNNLLILGTSKELMYKTIDKIVDNL